MSISTTRAELAEALEGTGYLVFSYPSENMPVPAIVLVPGQPYVSVLATGFNRLDLGFKATLMVAMIDNQASLLNLEDLITKFLNACPAGVQIGEFSQPSLTQVGPVDVLTTDVQLNVTSTKE